jgi:hypothetical protein
VWHGIIPNDKNMTRSCVAVANYVSSLVADWQRMCTTHIQLQHNYDFSECLDDGTERTGIYRCLPLCAFIPCQALGWCAL